MATSHTLSGMFGHGVIRAQNESSMFKGILLNGLQLCMHWDRLICLKHVNNSLWTSVWLTSGWNIKTIIILAFMFGGTEMTRFSFSCKWSNCVIFVFCVAGEAFKPWTKPTVLKMKICVAFTVVAVLHIAQAGEFLSLMRWCISLAQSASVAWLLCQIK